MKKLRFILAFVALLGLIAPPPVSAATGDVHIFIVGANGSINEIVLPAPTTAGALYQDGAGNYSFLALPSVPQVSNSDFTVTTAGLTAGTGTLLSKFTMSLTFSKAFTGSGVPTVIIDTKGVCAYASAINVTNTGCTVLLPISVGGTFSYIAAKQ